MRPHTTVRVIYTRSEGGREVSEVDLQQVEARLEARLEELTRMRAAVRHDSGSELVHLDNHPGDLGSETHDEELDETTAIFLEEEERRIEEARRALADGSYGRCNGCGGQ